MCLAPQNHKKESGGGLDSGCCIGRSGSVALVVVLSRQCLHAAFSWYVKVD